jgi:hypothetical protein
LLLPVARLPIARRELHRRRPRNIGLRDTGLGDIRLRDTWLGHARLGQTWLGNAGRSTGRGLRAALECPQAVLELPVAVLQFLVLAGELPQLILKLLNPHFRVDSIGLRQSL